MLHLLFIAAVFFAGVKYSEPVKDYVKPKISEIKLSIRNKVKGWKK